MRRFHLTRSSWCLAAALSPTACGPVVDVSLDTSSAVSCSTSTECDAADECSSAKCDPQCIDAGRYSVDEEIVVDGQGSHRLWQRHVTAQLAQQDAVAYCAELSLGGLQGWRLPSPDELSGIRYKPGGLFGGGGKRHYCIPSIDQAAFPETPADLFWTSRANADDTAWYVGFDDGRSHRDVKSATLWVRCTHDPL